MVHFCVQLKFQQFAIKKIKVDIINMLKYCGNSKNTSQTNHEYSHRNQEYMQFFSYIAPDFIVFLPYTFAPSHQILSDGFSFGRVMATLLHRFYNAQNTCIF